MINANGSHALNPPVPGARRPLVSFVIIGRNDDYMGDYLYRLGTSLSFLAQSAERAGLLNKIEILVVDWASERPLADALVLTPAARQVVRFLEVTPEIVRARYGDVRFLSTTAVNVGVRRSRGAFIMFTDSDCLWSEPAIAALDRLLRGETPLPAPIDDVICYVRRYQIPWATVQRRPHLDEWRRLAAVIVAGAQPEAPEAACLGGFSAGQLMHRRLWHGARGYDEGLDRPWGWSDNDLMLRVSQEHTWLDVSSYGVVGLHMEHWSPAQPRAERDPSTVNPMTVRDTPVTNGPEWGLGDLDLRPVGSRSTSEPASGPGCEVPLSGNAAAPAWHADPKAEDFIRRVRADQEPTRASVGQLAAIAQVALADLPRNIYWFGAPDPGVLLTLLRACPAAELFFSNPWPEGSSDAHPFHPGELAGFLRARGRFKGWARILQGDPSTTFERLDRSHAGAGPVEFAWMAPDATPDLVADLIPRLAPGGVVLIPADGDRPHTLEQLRGVTPGCITRELDGSGLLSVTRTSHS